MKQLLLFLALTLFGVLAGRLAGVNPISQSWFPRFASFALVVGLYGSVVGIDLGAIRRRRRMAILIVTLGVPLQIMATGLVMYLIYPMAISFLLAVAIDQIDPLSVQTLLQDKEKMSDEAKGILRVWAAFDDPVTVLFGFLILVPLLSGERVGLDLPEYALGLALNLGPAALIWLVYLKTKLLENRTVALVLLAAVLVFAFFTQSYLLAAITGLLLRPLPARGLERLINVLYYIIVFIVGMAIYSYGVDLRLGILLALVEFFIIQPLSALIAFNGTTGDVFRIAYAQQNGLTTLLMGIAFQSLGFEVLPILLPAIVAVNVCNLVVNKIYSWKERRGLIG
ncbi:MAG: cation:proton antiporter [Chloroflexi bacterium]|nr:cation:proton antiporter [Chloroflexota bacterium]MCI0579028.1 cation:proton antiporter [Chloroflexota bacterium]MCI0646955.1 cation:proton antiporter [Chloroflexota bacterium]MCI0730011.1 cation:proton antiporter [Chloroflexota bacterium]